jgi:hypothetical protein
VAVLRDVLGYRGLSVVVTKEGLTQNTDLPIANLLAYATSSYANQPLRISITVFEFDQLENENFKKNLE